MTCHHQLRFNDNSVLRFVEFTTRDGQEFMSFECGDCGNKTHNQPPVSGMHHCWACSKPILILPVAIRDARMSLKKKERSEIFL
jgi:ribosomal protein S27E